MSCSDKDLLFAQGIYRFDFYDLTTDELLFQSNTITEGNIATSVSLNEIRGGIGNGTLIQIPSDTTLTVTMTAANFSLAGLALNTGSTIMPNGIYQVHDTVELYEKAVEGEEGKTVVVGKVPSTPVAPIGSVTGEVIGYVDCNIKVTIDEKTKEFEVEGGKTGDKVCIYYYTQSASAEIFRIGSNFSPKIGRAVLSTPLYTNKGVGGTGSIIAGELQIIIPKAQLNGDLSLDLSQTANATTVLNMTALVDYETKAGECPSDDGTLGYIVQILSKGSIWDNVDNLVAIGGGVAISVGETETLVIKGYSNANTSVLENVPYTDLTFTSKDTAVATVDANGVITAVAEGDTDIVVEYEPKGISTRVDVEVVTP